MHHYLNNFKLTYLLLLAALFLAVALKDEACLAQETQRIALPESALQQGQIAAKTSEGASKKSQERYSLNIKNRRHKRAALKTKKVFKPEVGIVDIVIPQAAGSYGIVNLDDCIKIALKNHLPLQIAEKNMALAKMRIWEARRNMLPSATVGFEESTGRINARRYESRKQYIEGQQPVFRGGELYFTMKQAEVNLEVVTTDYQKIKNELILQVKKAYYTLAKGKENLKVQTDLSKEVNEIYEMVSKQSEAGVLPKVEFLNVKSQASQVKYQLVAAEGDVSVAEMVLKQAMNINTKDSIEIEPNLGFKKVEVDFEDALGAALVNRPDIKINSLMLNYYNYGKGIAKAKGWPRVDILGSWGLAKDEFTSEDALVGDDRKMEQQWYAGVKTSMPFWGSTGEYSWTREQWTPVVSTFHDSAADTSAFKFKILDKIDYYSDKKLAEIDFDKARQELNKSRQDTELEVRESCFNYEKALAQLVTSFNKLEYQKSDLEVAKMKRGMDEAQDSNVIDSTIKLAQEKFTYLQALADCHIALASINKAIGVEDYYKDEPVEKK